MMRMVCFHVFGCGEVHSYIYRHVIDILVFIYHTIRWLS